MILFIIHLDCAALNFNSLNEISETFVPVGEFVFHDADSSVVKNTGNNPADSNNLVQLIIELRS